MMQLWLVKPKVAKLAINLKQKKLTRVDICFESLVDSLALECLQNLT